MSDLQALLRDAEFNIRLILFTGSYNEKTEIDLTNHNFIYSNPSFFSILDAWRQMYKEQDFQNFEQNGLTEDNFHNLLEKTILLRKTVSIPLEKESTSAISTLSFIFYKYNSKIVADARDQLLSVLNEYDGPLKQQKKMISHKWVEDPDLPTEKTKSIDIDNPYVLLQSAIKKISILINCANSEKVVNLDNFKFNEHFQLLKTFENDIKNINLEQDEIDELLYNWSVLFLKGFALAQIEIIPPEKDVNDYVTDKNSNRAIDWNYTNDQARLYLYLRTFQANIKILLESSGDLHDEKLNEISQAHPDENLLKPFFEELIPYYKSLITTEGYVKLTIELSKKFEPAIEKEYKYAKKAWSHDMSDGSLTYSNYIFAYYFDFIPFELSNPPGENYIKLFHVCLNRLNDSCCYVAFTLKKFEYISQFDLENITDDLDNLQIQKYYLIWYMINYVRENGDFYLDPKCLAEYETSFSSLILSIMPWKIKSECEEARILEDMIFKNIKKAINDRRSIYPYTWYNYIQKVWNTNEPLNVDEMKKKMDPNDPSNPKERPKDVSLDGCCLIS